MKPGFTFELSGGELCLDFVNTLEHRGDAALRQEHLNTYADLLSWCRQTNALARPELAQLAGRGSRSLRQAREVLRRALRLREALYRIFSAVAAGRRPANDDLELLNSAARSAWASRALTRKHGAFRWEQHPAGAHLEAPLWPISRSAVDLLTSDRCASIRECAADECAWLFLDHSRNQSRRWCDMTVCGNRAKARSFYRRGRKGY
jgi:predicted RNA-binding Zn ribbon-like protein